MRKSISTFSLTLLLLFSVYFAGAQDKDFARAVMTELTSEAYAGRGFVDSGHVKAANFIAGQFEEFGLKKFNDSYLQAFDLSANTFPGKMSIFIDDEELFAGVDYLVKAPSPSVNGTFDLVWLNKKIVGNKKKMGKFSSSDFSNSFIIVDDFEVEDDDQKEFLKQMINNPFNAKGIIYVKDTKLTWSMAQDPFPHPVLEINRTVVLKKADKITLDIEAEYLPSVEAYNVVGYVEGEVKDSFIMVSAHYDHLGKMGTTVYFPGANDNASGTAMMLNLARYYSKNKPKYSMVFVGFGAEEIGLVGSFAYVEDPLFPLSQIKFQVNIDIMGDAADGITVVNGAVFKDDYDDLVKINEDKQHLPSVKPRGESANSDHYPFYKEGVSSFFIYSRGSSKAYHDIFDKNENTPLANYEGAFSLIRDFINQIK